MDEEKLNDFFLRLRKRAGRKNNLAEGFTRFVCKVAYDGTEFCGWQSQREGRAIQDVLERRLAQVLRAPVRIHGSGRTDAGVHAHGQVFHFDAEWEHSLATLTVALRSGLVRAVQISDIKTAHANFHARFSARGKRYSYRIFEGWASPEETRFTHSIGGQRLDTDAMRTAAALLLGIHDFSAFSGKNPETDGGSPVKDLRRLEVSRRGPRIEIVTEASGYLYKMVRRLAGALIQVGLGRMSCADLTAYLEAGKSTAQVPAAPARGLFLEKVFYRLPANAVRPPPAN
ncbi:MAG: tRNA pseudouridine(38-40) synthase TruA [Puniceicoccales bacterium]|jgi:tRNA pseudouridine38-40 synthase|nr:tRNA pseudouridine(38-40) synthase TruA [Puniceicoccales bacterium]